MNLHSINTNDQYNKFLKHLDPFGKFQKKLTFIAILFWFFSGITRTVFDKEIFCNVSEELPFLTLSTILGLLIGPYLSNYYSRKRIIMGMTVIFFIGALLLLVFQGTVIMKIGIYFISLAQYSICICASCIIFEYVEVSLIPILAWVFMFSFHTAKLGSIIIFSQINDHQQKQLILSSVILGFALLQIVGSFFFKQSLRYLIDNDIADAEILALQISEQNNCTDERILNIIEGSFIWNKVNIRKYGLSCFKKYNSIARETYYLGLSFFCLGIFGKFAIAIFQINQKIKNAQFQHEVQLLWIAIFQLIGFLPGIQVIIYKQLERKKVCLATAITATFFSIILLIFVEFIIMSHYLIVIFAILGINSFFESILFFFMFLQGIQFYPHTIRTLGIGLCMGLYFFGQLLFNLHIYFINDEESSFELVFCCSFLMVFHLAKIPQTLGKNINYQIKQIEEREYIQD